MTDALFALVSSYGVIALAVSCFLSCLLVPIPSSFLMLAGGAFVASGDLTGWQVVLAAWAGAVLGDQTGFAIGRNGGALLDRLAMPGTGRAALLGRARAFVDRRGGAGVFLSTWAVAPLGPYVNIIAGAAGMRWRWFALWDALGEGIWVAGYTGLGYLFGANLSQIAQISGQATGFLASLTVAALLFAAMLGQTRRRRARR